jgi:hypothetical protein
MAILINTPVAGFEELPSEDFNAWWDRTGKVLAELQATSNGLPEGEYVGAILAFPIGDGYALYLVQDTSPLTIQHIPYGDAYRIPGAHVNGLDMNDVMVQVKWNKEARARDQARSLAN